jgi:hypothetical protein
VRAVDVIPAFPEIAWCGTFADYRAVMAGTTEASDVAHFITLWACFAVALGRRISFYLGDLVYPNVYLDFYGHTGDKKTTAERRLFQLLPDVPDVRIIQAVGSTEGLSDALTIPPIGPRQDTTSLFFWEELSALLAQGGWKGSTIFEFITQTFDCPPEWSLKYRQKPVSIPRPTPTILTATTPDWFWRHARPQDFYGGFGNRFAHFTGRAKPPIPRPTQPDITILDGIRQKLTALSCVTPTKITLSPQGECLWDEFYIDWNSTDRSPLLAVAAKRLPVYVLKLAMVYAADEGTLPEIRLEQLQAAIGVVLYAEKCTEHLPGCKRSTAPPWPSWKTDSSNGWKRTREAPSAGCRWRSPGTRPGPKCSTEFSTIFKKRSSLMSARTAPSGRSFQGNAVTAAERDILFRTYKLSVNRRDGNGGNGFLWERY